MIQLNLLPDVKQDYIKAQQTKRLAISLSLIVCAASIALLVFLLVIDAAQKKHLNDLSDDIKTNSVKLQKEPQISKILTVQNQLNSLTDLHMQKIAADRFFVYLNQLTPTDVDITSFDTDFTTTTGTITGTADSLSSVNKYIDTLKFTTFTTGTGSTSQKAYSDVVLSSFGLNGTNAKNAKHPANYTITFAYKRDLVDVTQKVDFNVPNLTTTRANVDSPPALFQSAPSTTKSGGSN